MRGGLRAIALDFDGTIAEADHPDEAALRAVGECRGAGLKALLVTGRILEELRSVFPAVEECFDAIVAENGAVLAQEGTTRLLAAPVELELDEALVACGVPFRRGQVLLATRAAHEAAVTAELRRLALECALMRNRAELMVLPPGISKGFGVYQALGDLGVSHHSAIGFGDAENDHSLLRTCELGVAVADAVGSLKRQADVVLEKPGGAGVAEFLRGPTMTGERPLEPRRWKIELGRFGDGTPARIPASQVNVLIVGRSNSGKSYVAGLLAERLLALGYSLCVVDPEGDYAPLGRLRGMLTLGGAEGLPRPEAVERGIEHRFGSVLLDLSLVPSWERERYVPPLLERLEEERETRGLPHWVFLDEAHHLASASTLAQPPKGYCLITYRPEKLASEVLESIDVIVAIPGGKAPRAGHEADPLETLESLYGMDLPAAGEGESEGEVFLARPGGGEPVRRFRPGARRMPHVRHWHKYVTASLPHELQFIFRGEGGEARQVCGNVADFHRALVASAPEAIQYHARRGDFSRWLRQAIQDLALARRIHELEEGFRRSGPEAAGAAALRFDLLRALEARYGDGSE